jgi:hypothetical protein
VSIEMQNSGFSIGDPMIAMAHPAPLEERLDLRVLRAMEQRLDLVTGQVDALTQGMESLSARLVALENTPWKRFVRWVQSIFAKF